jgi:hypothetical protein
VAPPVLVARQGSYRYRLCQAGRSRDLPAPPGSALRGSLQ